VKKIEHIGIAVCNLEKSNLIFKKILGEKHFKEEIVVKQGVKTSFFKIGNSKIELIAANNSNSTIQKYLSKNKEGMHHLALHVEDIYKEIDRIKKEGIRILNKEPELGADNKLICFLHPRDTNGVLIELCQERE
tara:strand:+ start:2351 stop:2752 length:402 start_codon:yes stop_codon:yes gene_type:complete